MRHSILLIALLAAPAMACDLASQSAACETVSSAHIIRTALLDDEVLVDVRHLPFRGYDIELPITRQPDGRVCLSHVARMATDHEKMTVGLAQVCGAPAGDGKTPANLVEMKEVVAGDLMVQLPVSETAINGGIIRCGAHVTHQEAFESAGRIETDNHCAFLAGDFAAR